MPYYVYIIQSLKNEQFYKGYSENPVARLSQHNAGETSSTRPFMPWKLVYVELCDSKVAALKREKNLKRATRERLFALIDSNKNIVTQFKFG